MQYHDGPNYEVLRECVNGLSIPVFAEGRYNKEGKPMGKWNYGKAMMIYDSWGHFKEFYAVDPTTGDKIICNHYSVKRPPEAYVDAIEMINERCFRSTPKLK